VKAPELIALIFLIAGIALCVTGVYILWGGAFSIFAGSFWCLVIAAVIIRGLNRV
jgi:hypothetical protein